MAAVSDSFYKFYSAAQRTLAPGLRNSQHVYKAWLRDQLSPETQWLDLGCGHQVLPDWMPGAEPDQLEIIHCCRMVVGIDVDHLSLRKNSLLRNKLRGDIQRLPFPDESFDLVTANVVVEHVPDPQKLLREIHRVLRPGGKFLFHTPNFWGYATLCARLLPQALKLRLVYYLQGRREEDVFPAFYRFNTPRAIRRLAGQSHLRVVELRLVESSAQTVMLGPVVFLELLWIGMLRLRMLRLLRTNIIAVLQKAQQ